jgi:hypothetical protein
MKAPATVMVFCFALGLMPSMVQAQSDQATPFLGTWCAQGDPSKRTSIAENGPVLTLTNEVGSTSTGHVIGINAPYIIAPEWNLVRGTLSSDGRQISWSNGTFWARCPSGRRPMDLQGTWYFGGDRSKPCRIEQHGTSLFLRNESGQTATGSITGRGTISTIWSRTTITGTIGGNRSKILWSNGTYWSR